MTIRKRIEKLRQLMVSAGVDAYIISGQDPHGSEFPPLNWRTREWISGFSGSAGVVAVSSESAGIWTDFRYWIQAEEELQDSGIMLFRDGEADVPAIEEWLIKQLPTGSTVALDGRTFSVAKVMQWKKRLDEKGIILNGAIDFLGELWIDRPSDMGKSITELKESVTGEMRKERIARLEQRLRESDADTWIGTALDSSAWLLNLRGSDIPYSPVIIGYLIFSKGKITWYTHLERIPASVKESLRSDAVSLEPYQAFSAAVEALSPDSRILVDQVLLNYEVINKIPESAFRIDKPDIVNAMKARKTSAEMRHIRQAMEKDGAAIVRFLMGLQKRIKAGEKLGEIQAAENLLVERQRLPGFLGESFAAISALGPHGAICHYQAEEGTEGILSRNAGLYLIDSGGQWEEGTTDITRTISLGNPTDAQKTDYTRVLKAHIALSRMRFPEGTRGYQLDAVTRSSLWMEGIDYGHGTGHGIGFRLNVHEGPQTLSQKPIDVSVEAGMLLSNEPGIYREGHYGIRIENLLYCRLDTENEFGQFLAFETLTLAPYDRTLIDLHLLSDGEIDWVNAYHRMVKERLVPLLDSAERQWLDDAVREL